MYTYIAAIRALPGKEAELSEFIIQLCNEIRKEPGCVMIMPHHSKDDPAEIVIYEKYVDEQAYAVHSQAEYMRESGKRFKELLAAPAQIKFLTDL